MKKAMTASAALIAAAALGLSACSSPSQGQSANPSDTASAASDNNGTGSGETVSFEYIHRLPDGEGMTKVEEIVAKWNKDHPNIQVKSTKWDGKAPELITKLEQDVQAQTAACLAQVGYGEVPELFVKNLFEDVTQEAEKYKGDFAETPYVQMTVAGKTVGLPQDVGPLVYFYNEAEFQALGLEVPTNLDEFKAVAAKAAAAGKYTAAFFPDEAGYWLSAQAASAGASWFKSENDQWVVDVENPETQVVSDLWQGLIDNKQALVVDRWTQGFGQALTTGKLIGYIGAAWESGFAFDELDSTQYAGQWRVAQIPDFGKGKISGADGGSGVAVMKGCPHPAEAMEFLHWFNTQTEDLGTQGLVVATKEPGVTSDKLKKQFGGQDVMKELSVAANAMNSEFIYAPGFSALLSPMSQAATKAGTGEAKVAEIFSGTQKTAVDTLKGFNLPVAEN